MQLSRSDFWKMTFVEFWATYDGMFPKPPEPMTRSRLEEMKRADAERSKKNG